MTNKSFCLAGQRSRIRDHKSVDPAVSSLILLFILAKVFARKQLRLNSCVFYVVFVSMYIFLSVFSKSSISTYSQRERYFHDLATEGWMDRQKTCSFDRSIDPWVDAGT